MNVKKRQQGLTSARDAEIFGATYPKQFTNTSTALALPTEAVWGSTSLPRDTAGYLHCWLIGRASYPPSRLRNLNTEQHNAPPSNCERGYRWRGVVCTTERTSVSPTIVLAGCCALPTEPRAPPEIQGVFFFNFFN